GLNPLGAHLFILYWGMMSYVTPPVSLAAITAAGVAGADNTRTGLFAMRLGSVLFILPFLFVLNPSLILQGSVGWILLSATSALLAIWLFASALEGWLYRVGILGWPSRAVLLAAGATLIYPDPLTDVIGLAAIGSVYAVHFLFVRKRPGAA
ncbi:MAG: TRAP transporter large permease subunit, partial [Albimonas sp.]|uniref:TRAP transporter large permease subunit n=1 Tax=Albimonas sp. TaxID=1872425 RepID=UPI004056D9F1